jgi:hypothetical protein
MDEVKMVSMVKAATTKKYPLPVKHKSSLNVDFFKLNIYVTEDKFFKRNMPDITPNLLALKNREDCIRLTRKPPTFYQNQFNMVCYYWLRNIS